MIKATPSPKVETLIRKLAADAGVPLSQFLNPFLQAIADGRLVMVPHFPPQSPSKKEAA